MPAIEEILRVAKEAGACDVHLTVGIPPKMRVNGNLITMDYEKLLPSDTLDVLISIMTEIQREHFEERGEYDMSFSIPNLGRYRVSAYKQRGFVALAFRLVGTKVPSPESLGVPDSVIERAKEIAEELGRHDIVDFTEILSNKKNSATKKKKEHFVY